MKETLKQAGYTFIRRIDKGIFLLKDNTTGIIEMFMANKNHASWGLIYKNTHLEFMATYIGQ